MGSGGAAPEDSRPSASEAGRRWGPGRSPGDRRPGETAAVSWGLYIAGWAVGWLLLWSTRGLPARPTGPAGPAGRGPVAIVVPARDEATALPHLLAPLMAQLRAGDELVVVDDHSTDDTATVAARLGASVVPAPELPAGLGRQAARLLRPARPRRRRRRSCSSTPTSDRATTSSTASPRRSPPIRRPSRRSSRGTTPAAPANGRRAGQRRGADGQRRLHRPRHAGVDHGRLRTGAGGDPRRLRRRRRSRPPRRPGQPHRGHRPGPQRRIAAGCSATAPTPRSGCTRSAFPNRWPGGRGRWPPAWRRRGGGCWSPWRRGCGPWPAGRSPGGLAYPLSALQVWCSGVAPGASAPLLAMVYPVPCSCSSASSCAAGWNRASAAPRRGRVGPSGRRLISGRRGGSCRRWRRPPCGRWASATSSSGNRRSITGRRSPVLNSGSTSSAKRRLMACFSSERPAAQHRADPARPLGQQQPEVDRRRSAAHQADLDDRALRAEHVEVAVGLVAPDHVEDRCRRRRGGRARRARPAAPPASRPASARGRGRRRAREHASASSRCEHVRDAGADGLDDLDPRRADTGGPGVDSAQRPLVRPPCTTSASHAVMKTSGTAAASSRASPGGTGSAWRWWVTSCSA